MHFSGAVYAETFISNAIADNLCVDTCQAGVHKNVGLTKSIPAQPVCAEGNVPAANAMRDQSLYDHLINAFSLRSFVPNSGYSGHDQFFDTFNRFNGLDKSHQGAWLDELTTRAAAQNEQYLEIMQTPSFTNATKAAAAVGWTSDLTDANHMQVLAELRSAYLAAGLRDDIAIDSKEFDAVQRVDA